MLSEQEIIEGSINQERKAQKALFELCAEKLFNVCLRYSKSAQDAEDLMHDVFIVVLNKLKTFKGNSSLTSWICAIAVNKAISEIRKQKNKIFVDLDVYEAEATLSDYDHHDKEDVAEPSLDSAVEALKSLPEGYRVVLNLYAVENYSHKQIAEALNISVGTSKSQLARARKKLSEILEKK